MFSLVFLLEAFGLAKLCIGFLKGYVERIPWLLPLFLTFLAFHF